MCGIFPDILETEKELSVNFSQFKVKISSVNVCKRRKLEDCFFLFQTWVLFLGHPVFHFPSFPG